MLLILQVLGGMALFLQGVNMLSKGMEKLAGAKISGWLDKMTNTHIKGAMFGAGATALLQSSSMMMVTMVSLINANLMSLEQAISVMMGQEIGTTLTAQIASLNMGNYYFVFLIVGFVMLEFINKAELKKYGEILLGFGVLFLGMTIMTGGLKTLLVESPAMADIMAAMSRHILLGVLAGIVATALVHSSGAITGLAVALGLSGSIELQGGIAVLLGANVGTCITGLMAASRLSKASLQASIAQIMINVIGVLLFLPFVRPFGELVTLTANDVGRQIANAHTIFNVTVSILFFPFIGLLTKFVKKIIPVTVEVETKLTTYIDKGQLGVPTIALTEAFREIMLIGNTCIEMVEKASTALLQKDKEAVKWVLNKEANYVDPVIDELDTFVNDLYQSDLDASQQKRAFQLKGLIVDVERVADLAENLAESAKEKSKHKVEFSPKGDKAIEVLSEAALRTLKLSISALATGDVNLAQQAIELENEFDHMYMKERQRHVERLEKHVCSPEADVIFVDTIRNLERISDHAENISENVIHSSPGYVKPINTMD